MKDTGIVRKTDTLHRIVIPAELRKSMCIVEKTAAEVYVEGNENIIIEKATENSVVVRNVDELGRIVIPREILKTHGIAQKTPVRFFTDGARLIVRKEAS